jgi:predicted regulator of Ras-like GTPase activity (Roadblock/LC7/MglB family)
MENILQALLDLPGVSATLVFDGAGALVASRGHPVYDRALCEQVSATLVRATDAVQLQQRDWEWITAQFADGKLLLRNLGAARDGRTHVLALVAEAELNASFATAAIRVAATKLKRSLDDGAAPAAATAAPREAGAGAATPPPAASSSAHLPADSRPVLANSGLSWSKISSVGLSRVAIADPAAGAFLTRCAKELARHVGPIAKVYVEEAVRRVSPEAPFALPSSGPLLEDLAGQIEDPDDRARFRRALSGE